MNLIDTINRAALVAAQNAIEGITKTFFSTPALRVLSRR